MSPSSYCWEQHPCKWFPSFPEKRERCAETRRSRAHMSSTHDEEAPQKLLRVVVYTTLSRALGVQGIYRASISNICSAVAGTAYVVCAEPFILWLPRLQICNTLYPYIGNTLYPYTGNTLYHIQWQISGVENGIL